MLRKAMNDPDGAKNTALLKFATGDADQFVENMSGIAPGLSCQPLKSQGMRTEICGAKLPDLGIFTSTLVNFRVQSEGRSFYGITIPFVGNSDFLVEGTFESYHRERVHLQHPYRVFDARMGDSPFESLQLCFDKVALDSFAARFRRSGGRKVEFLETLDLARPAVRSFVRHAVFVWQEIQSGGPITTSPLIAQETVRLLESLLVNAAAADTEESDSAHCPNGAACLQKAEEYLMGNLANPISIADVASVAGVSARTLSREFRRRRGTTIKCFLKVRRLEAANRALIVAEPGEINVTRVALDLGFDQLGRFSADYKRAFGELPSETLAR